MARYSKKSLDKLATCDQKLEKVFSRVIEYFDNTILQGHRNKTDQNKAYSEGKSKLKWPDGNHNSLPSKAVDSIPYPIDWNDRERMCFYAGQVIATGREMGVRIRWGGDWNNDTQIKDNSFDDLVHFELTEEEGE